MSQGYAHHHYLNNSFRANRDSNVTTLVFHTANDISTTDTSYTFTFVNNTINNTRSVKRDSFPDALGLEYNDEYRYQDTPLNVSGNNISDNVLFDTARFDVAAGTVYEMSGRVHFLRHVHITLPFNDSTHSSANATTVNMTSTEFFLHVPNVTTLTGENTTVMTYQNINQDGTLPWIQDDQGCQCHPENSDFGSTAFTVAMKCGEAATCPTPSPTGSPPDGSSGGSATGNDVVAPLQPTTNVAAIVGGVVGGVGGAALIAGALLFFFLVWKPKRDAEQRMSELLSQPPPTSPA